MRFQFSCGYVPCADTASRSRRAFRASFALKSRPLDERAQGMPGARCARSRAWCVVNTRVSHHGHTGNTRHSPHNGFNGFLRALLGDRAFLPPSPLRSLLLKNLTPASGRRGVRTTRLRRPPCAPFVLKRQSVHRIPRSTSMTIAKRPSVRRDGGRYGCDLRKARREIFLREGLDR